MTGGMCYVCGDEMTEQEINNDEIDIDTNIEKGYALIGHKRCTTKT